MKIFSLVVVFVLFVDCFSGDVFAQDAVAPPVASKLQPVYALPEVVVAKYDEERTPKVLMVLLPQKLGRLIQFTYMAEELVSQTEATATPTGSSGDKTIVVPVATQKNVKPRMVMKVGTDMVESYGRMERKDIPLEDLSFHKLDGTEIPKEQALARLKIPTHIFYENGPELYFQSIVRDDVMILKSVEGKFLPDRTLKIIP